MIGRRLLRAATLLALGAPLGGCVAAAIPVIAAGGLAGREVLDDGDDSAEQRGPGVADRAASERQPPARIASPATQDRSVAGAATDRLPAAGGTPAAPARQPISTTGQQTATSGPYAAFEAHALVQASLDPVDTPRRSAVLASPSTLSPQTTDCTILPPAVLVDLDPELGIFDPAADLSQQAAFAKTLETLRASTVDVFWISRASAAEAGAVRKALLDSGLDPWGRDGLLLMRRAEDRKQVRRRELAESHCVIAIAGDARSDFDELYDYLKDPAAAAPLEPLIDAGWFVVPNPIAAKDD